MGSWSGSRRALSEPVRGWVTSGSGISQREDTELIEMNQESGTDVVRKGEEDNGTLHMRSRQVNTGNLRDASATVAAARPSSTCSNTDEPFSLYEF